MSPFTPKHFAVCSMLLALASGVLALAAWQNLQESPTSLKPEVAGVNAKSSISWTLESQNISLQKAQDLLQTASLSGQVVVLDIGPQTPSNPILNPDKTLYLDYNQADFLDRLHLLERDTTYIVHSTDPSAGSRVIRLMQEMRFTQVYYLSPPISQARQL